MVAPTEKMSDRASISSVRPSACSGAMKAGVPKAEPSTVIVPALPSCSRAMPKSSSLSTPSCVTKTFSGLMSRWTIPFWCAAWTTSSSRSASARTSAGGRLPPRRSARASRLSPSSSSITRKADPSSATSSSRTCTAPGCPTALAT